MQPQAILAWPTEFYFQNAPQRCSRGSQFRRMSTSRPKWIRVDTFSYSNQLLQCKQQYLYIRHKNPSVLDGYWKKTKWRILAVKQLYVLSKAFGTKLQILNRNKINGVFFSHKNIHLFHSKNVQKYEKLFTFLNKIFSKSTKKKGI